MALIVRGAILSRKGCFEDAIRHFDRAIDKNPNLLDAWFYKGVALFNKGDNPGALVEVAPPYDASGITALAGATLMFEILCLAAQSRAPK